MEKIYVRLGIAVIAATLALSTALSAQADTVVTNDALLQATDIQGKATIVQTSDANAIAEWQPIQLDNGTNLAGYTFGGNGEISLTVRFADVAAISTETISGQESLVVQHRGGGSSFGLVHNDGSLQIFNRMDSAEDSSIFTYELTLPSGAKMVKIDDGNLAVLDSQSNFVMGVTPAWARDANGKSVPTHYEIRDNKLTQIVDIGDPKSVSFPVISDPWLGVDLYYTPSVSNVSRGYIINATPTAWGKNWVGIATWFAHRDELVTKLGSRAWMWTNSIQEQLYCHLAGFPFSLPTYNMDSWRPLVPWDVSLALYKCNP